MAILIQKNKNNFLANFENFDQFCSQHKASSLRQNEFAQFYILGLSKQVKIDNLIREQRNTIRQNHEEEIRQISSILKRSFIGVDIIPLSHNQNIEINQQGKALSIEIGTDEKINSDYNYFYRIKFSNDLKNIEGIIENALKLRNVDYIFDFEDKVMQIPANALQSIVSQKNKINLSSIKITNENLETDLYSTLVVLDPREQLILKQIVSNENNTIKEHNSNIQGGLLDWIQEDSIKKHAIITAKELLSDGMSIEKIIKYTKLSKEEILNIKI